MVYPSPNNPESKSEAWQRSMSEKYKCLGCNSLCFGGGLLHSIIETVVNQESLMADYLAELQLFRI